MSYNKVSPWERQTDGQTDGSRYRLMPPTVGRGHKNTQHPSRRTALQYHHHHHHYHHHHHIVSVAAGRRKYWVSESTSWDELRCVRLARRAADVWSSTPNLLLKMITVLHLGAFYVRKCAPWQIIRVEM